MDCTTNPRIKTVFQPLVHDRSLTETTEHVFTCKVRDFVLLATTGVEKTARKTATRIAECFDLMEKVRLVTEQGNRGSTVGAGSTLRRDGTRQCFASHNLKVQVTPEGDPARDALLGRDAPTERASVSA